MTDELRAVVEADEIDLRHYASKYYDPAKAREYYLRTRELQGNSGGSTEKLSKESRQKQTEAKAYVRDQVRTERTTVQKTTSEAQKVRLEKLRDDAKATRDRIMDKLKGLTDQLKAAADIPMVAKAVRKPVERIVIEPEVIPKPNLNVIPATASPKLRAFLTKQNDRMTSKYNGEVKKAQTKAQDESRKANEKANAEADKQFEQDQEVVRKANDKTREVKELARETSAKANDAARAELKAVGTSLKDAVAKARTDYAAARKDMAAKYSTDLKTELQNIEDKVR